MMPASTTGERKARVRALEQAIKAMAAEAVPTVMHLVRTRTSAGCGGRRISTAATTDSASLPNVPAVVPADDSDESDGGGRFGSFSVRSRALFQNSAEDEEEAGTPVRRPRLAQRLSLAVLAGQVKYQSYTGKVSSGHGAGPARRYRVGGLLYRFAGDRFDVQKYGSEEAARKALTHRMRGLNAIAESGVPGLAPYPYLMVDYLGYRVLVTTQLPGVEAGDTLVHGSVFPGRGPGCKDPVNCDSELGAAMVCVAKKLNIKGHWVGATSEGRTFLHGPVDMQVRRSDVDNRLYLTSGSGRLFPPQSPHERCTDGQWYLSQHLRPELVRRSQRQKEPRGPMPLSSDAWSPFGDSRRDEHDFHVSLVTDLLRTSLVEHLVDDLVVELWVAAQQCSVYPPKVDTNALFLFPGTTKDRLTMPPMHSECWLSKFFHKRGVNMRQLGAVQVSVFARLLRVKALESADCSTQNIFAFRDAADPALPGGPIHTQAGFFAGILGATSETLRTEMVARSLRDILNDEMRRGGGGLMEAIDHVFGDDAQLSAAQMNQRIAFWFDVVMPRVKAKFGALRQDHLDPYTLDDVHKPTLFWRMQQLTGLMFERGGQIVPAYVADNKRFTRGLTATHPRPLVTLPSLPAPHYAEGERRYLLRQSLAFIRTVYPPGRIVNEGLKARADKAAAYVQDELGSSFHRQDVEVLLWKAERSTELLFRAKKARKNIVFLKQRAGDAAERAQRVNYPLHRDPSKIVEFRTAEDSTDRWGLRCGQRVTSLAQARSAPDERTEAEQSPRRPTAEGHTVAATIIGERNGWLWRHTDGDNGATAFNARSREELDQRYGVHRGGGPPAIQLVFRASQPTAPLLVQVRGDDDNDDTRKYADLSPRAGMAVISTDDATSGDVFEYLLPDGALCGFHTEDAECTKFGPGLRHGDRLLLPETETVSIGGAAGERAVLNRPGGVATVLGVRRRKGHPSQLWVAWDVSGVAVPLSGEPGKLISRNRIRVVGQAEPEPCTRGNRLWFQGSWYQVSVRSMVSRYGYHHGQRLLLMQGEHSGVSALVLGVIDKTLHLVLEHSGYVYAIVGATCAHDVYERHAPELAGVGRIHGVVWAAGDTDLDTGDLHEMGQAPSPFKISEVHGADSSVSDWSAFTYRLWTGEVRLFDARAAVCRRFGACFGQKVRITKGRWLQRTGPVIGVRPRTLDRDREDESEPCLWAHIDGYSGAVPLDESKYCCAGGASVRPPMAVGDKDVAWADEAPLQSFKQLIMTGEVVVLESADSACAKFQLYHGQRVIFSEHHEPSRVGVVLGVRRGELWAVADGSVAAEPLLGRDAAELLSTNYVRVVGTEVPTPLSDALQPLGADSYYDRDRGAWKGSEPLVCYAGMCGRGHRLRRHVVGVMTSGATAHACRLCGVVVAEGDVYRCLQCDVTECRECVADAGPSGVAAHCTAELEFIGFDVSRAALASAPHSLRPGDHVEIVHGHKFTAKRTKRPGIEGCVNQEYFWQKVGMFAVFIGSHLGELWVEAKGTTGATPVPQRSLRQLRVSKRAPAGTSPPTVTEMQRQAHVSDRAAEAAERAAELSKDSTTLIKQGRCSFPPADVRRLSGALVEPYLRFVRAETVAAVAQVFYPFGVPATRRALEWVLDTYGLGLSLRETEVDGFRKLAVAMDVFRVPIDVPLRSEYDAHVAESRADWRVAACKGVPSFADLCARRQNVLRARRQVQREQRVAARAERQRKWMQHRDETVSRAMDLHLSPQEMRRLVRPRMSVACVAERMRDTAEEVAKAAQRRKAGPAYKPEAKVNLAEEQSVGECRPPPLTGPLNIDAGHRRYLCRGGDLKRFAIHADATQRWAVPFASRVRYTRGDLTGTTAVVIGVHGDRLWRYDEGDPSKIAQPFAAPDAAALQRTHGVAVVETDVPVRQCDPFMFLCWDGSVGVFDVSPEACRQYGVFHGQRYACGVTPPALWEAELQQYGSPPPSVLLLRRDETLDKQRLRRPWIVTIIGVHEGQLWYAVGDRSGAFPYVGAKPIAEEWELQLLYTSAITQLGTPSGGGEPFRYLGRARSGLGLRPKRPREDPLEMAPRRERSNSWGAEPMHSPRRRIDLPPISQTGDSASGHSWNESDGFWASMVFDTRAEAFAAQSTLLRHGVRIEYSDRPEMEDGSLPYLRRAVVIGVSRQAVWAHPLDAAGASPLRPHQLRTAKRVGREVVLPLNWPSEDDSMSRSRSGFRFLTAAGTVGLFETSDDVLVRFEVRFMDKVQLRHGKEWEEAIVVGVRDSALWVCAPPAEGSDVAPFAKPLLGVRNARGLQQQFGLQTVGRAVLEPFSG
eukprot:TRINITY_DN17102_c0_g3_i2.p1 TRINITY_DN17102_c0_g3~~TRINITY_DN17102_c0_g3_i2.p1  ORF type:complete len:2312 (+),score=480.74 TRINITY_DN17102_c0_g3_i2:367-7302(+)